MNETKPIITAERKLMFTVGGVEYSDLLAAKKHGITQILTNGEITHDEEKIAAIALQVDRVIEHSEEVVAILRTKERIRPPGPQPGKPRKPRKAKVAPAQSNPTA